MPRIVVSKSVKVGVGKYESVDVMASIEFDFNTAQKTPAEAYAYAWATVDKQINLQLAEIQDIAKPDSVFLTKQASGKKG